jgi:hypothetical protein
MPPTTTPQPVPATSPDDVAKVIAEARVRSAALGLYLWLAGRRAYPYGWSSVLGVVNRQPLPGFGITPERVAAAARDNLARATG